MDTAKAVSATLLLLALLMALTFGKLETVVNCYPLVMGFLLGILASVIEAFKTNFLLESSAKTSIEYFQAMPNVVVSGNFQLVQKAFSWLSGALTKTLGKAILLFSKLVELALKATAALCGLIYLVFPRDEILGLWIILSTLLLVVMLKFSGLLGMFFPFGEQTTRTKKLVGTVGFLSLITWAILSLELTFFFQAFGHSLSAICIFLFLGLLSLIPLIPFTFDGVGAIELVGMGIFWLHGKISGIELPLITIFICLILWEISKFCGDFIVSRLPEPKPDLSQYT